MGREYSLEYKTEAVKLAKEIGKKRASEELGVPEGTIGTWLHKTRRGEIDIGVGQQSPKGGLTLAGELQECRARIKQLEKENARIRKENAFLEEASAFFAASRQKLAKTRD